MCFGEFCFQVELRRYRELTHAHLCVRALIQTWTHTSHTYPSSPHVLYPLSASSPRVLHPPQLRDLFWHITTSQSPRGLSSCQASACLLIWRCLWWHITAIPDSSTSSQTLCASLLYAPLPLRVWWPLVYFVSIAFGFPECHTVRIITVGSSPRVAPSRSNMHVSSPFISNRVIQSSFWGEVKGWLSSLANSNGCVLARLAVVLRPLSREWQAFMVMSAERNKAECHFWAVPLRFGGPHFLIHNLHAKGTEGIWVSLCSVVMSWRNIQRNDTKVTSTLHSHLAI